MADQLLAREWMLAVGKPLEVFFTNFSDEPLEMRQLAVPDAANQIAFRVVVLARVLKLLRRDSGAPVPRSTASRS